MTIIDIPRTAPSSARRSVSLGSPHRAPVPAQCAELLADANRALGRALGAEPAAERYVAAHLAALRGAAALLATRARPRRSARRSAWDLLTAVAPEFDQWAAYFAASAVKRQAIEAGREHVVSRRDADDLARQCGEFLDLIEQALHR